MSTCVERDESLGALAISFNTYFEELIYFDVYLYCTCTVGSIWSMTATENGDIQTYKLILK